VVVTAGEVRARATDALRVRSRRLRLALVAGCLAATLLPPLLGADLAPARLAEPALEVLIRGMAAIKLLLVAGAVAVLWWRFGRPVSAPMAGAYLAGACLAAIAPPLIWQLKLLWPAAILFHAGELALLLTAWRDRAH
jgi:hypothetical protein